jgi:threonine/homoserine/homoserine lactone efflux protein
MLRFSQQLSKNVDESVDGTVMLVGVNGLIEAAVTGIVAGLGVAMPLGAVGVLLVREAMVNGTRAGLRAATGVAVVDVLYAGLAVGLGAAIARLLGTHIAAISIVGGVVLIAIAVRGLIRGVGGVHPAPPAAQLHGTVRFVLLTLVNPLTAVYFTVFAVTSGGRQQLFAAAVFVAAVGLSSWCWQAILAVSGSLVGRRLSDRHRRWTILAGYGLVLVYGGRLLLLG